MLKADPRDSLKGGKSSVFPTPDRRDLGELAERSRWLHYCPGKPRRIGEAITVIKRPIVITVLSWLFIAVGSIGVVAALLPLIHPSSQDVQPATNVPPALELTLMEITRILAVVAGVFMLRGFNWARWLLLFWMAFHVAISWGDTQKLLVHAAFFLALLYLLFRPASSLWFKARSAPNL
jgi:hypothetical protein